MINNLESKSKKELAEIIDFQLAEYAKLVKSECELETQNAELVKERDELKSLALLITTDVIDLVRCGISGNYGGVRYEEKINETHIPILRAFSGIQPSLQAHNLEQKIECLSITLSKLGNSDGSRKVYAQYEELRNQAKALKDGE